MKAEPTQIPVSDTPNNGQKPLSKPALTGNIWAHIRRIEARLDSIDSKISTARRDIDRIERKFNRDEAKVQPEEITQPDNLAGLWR